MDQVLTVFFTVGLVFAAMSTLDAWRERYGDRDKWSGLPPVVPFWFGICACIALSAILGAILAQSAKEPFGLLPWAIDMLTGDPHRGPGRPILRR